MRRTIQYTFTIRKQPVNKVSQKIDAQTSLRRAIMYNQNRYDDGQFIWFIDRYGKINKVIKEFQPKENEIRLKFLEPIWRRWRATNRDIRNAIIPIFFGILGSSIIYNGGNFFIEREYRIEEKASLDPDINEENFNKWKAEKMKN